MFKNISDSVTNMV